jgi:hypothetical protein
MYTYLLFQLGNRFLRRGERGLDLLVDIYQCLDVFGVFVQQSYGSKRPRRLKLPVGCDTSLFACVFAYRACEQKLVHCGQKVDKPRFTAKT